jgi:hypothetical protein
VPPLSGINTADLAMELSTPIATDDFRTLNRCLDDAIAAYGIG